MWLTFQASGNGRVPRVPGQVLMLGRRVPRAWTEMRRRLAPRFAQ
jgi:hypothetical protein